MGAIPLACSVNVEQEAPPIDPTLVGAHVLVNWPQPHGWCLANVTGVFPRRILNVRVKFVRGGSTYEMRFVHADGPIDPDVWVYRGGPEATEHSWFIVNKRQ